jgi:hypothetical protein
VTHDHDHHAPIHGADELSEFDVLETAIRELAIEKGLFSPEDHRRFMEWGERIGPHGGSRLVARAWLDPEFKQRLLSDGTETSKEIGIDWLYPTGTGTPSDNTFFYVLENTPEVHNMIVCTLCSCYPRPVLGQAPEWYKTPHYRRRPLASRSARRVRAAPCARRGSAGARLQPEVALHGHADAARGHGRLDRGSARRDRDPRHDDRRRPPSG